MLPAAVEQCRNGGIVVAQINPNMPWTFGDSEFDVADVDLAIEAQEPLTSPAPRSPGPVEAAIGERVAGLVADRSTLQLGIGGVPDATLASLTGRRHLRLWTEMLCDGVLRLDQAGAAGPRRPARRVVPVRLPGAVSAWAHDNPRLRMLRTELTNDPGRIAQQPLMTSVNSALQIDLYAQANASWVRGRIYSGFGGRSRTSSSERCTAPGARRSSLSVRHPKADRSTIVPVLQQAGHELPALLGGHRAGRGRDHARAARGPGAQPGAGTAAHPDARAGLEQAAAERGLLR